MARKILISFLLLFCFCLCAEAEGVGMTLLNPLRPLLGGLGDLWSRADASKVTFGFTMEAEVTATEEWFISPAETAPETQDRKATRAERKKKRAEKKSGKTEETKQSENEVEAIAIEPRQVEQFLKNRGITDVQGVPMEFTVIDGDTVFLDTIEPAWILPKGTKMKGGDWRRYSRLVFNFNKMYPYALVGREMMAQVDSTIAADVSKRSERTRYINDVEKELFRLFEQDIRSMTITQGFLLLRLVDRECGMSAYEIIRTYESGFAAAFWQLVARLFSQNLKTRYDPEKGEDAKIEELCQIWDSGQWKQFYWSIFMEEPPKTTIKTTTLESEVQKKRRRR